MGLISVETQQRKDYKFLVFVLFEFVTLLCIIYFLGHKTLQTFESRMQHTMSYTTNMTSKWNMCKKVKFSSTPLPKTALASFPGSGNTWTRHLIQQSTGIATGTMYRDNHLMRNGFPGEGIRNSSVIVVKTHGFRNELRNMFYKSILIIRNPFDAFLAEFNRIYGGHSGYAKEIHFTNDWQKFVTVNIDKWRNMYIEWLKFSGPLYLLVYEDLKLNLSYEVTKLLEFLGMEITDNDLNCVVRNSEGKFKRIKFNNTNQDRYTSKMREKINEMKQDVQNAINRHGKIKKKIY